MRRVGWRPRVGWRGRRARGRMWVSLLALLLLRRSTLQLSQEALQHAQIGIPLRINDILFFRALPPTFTSCPWAVLSICITHSIPHSALLLLPLFSYTLQSPLTHRLLVRMVRWARSVFLRRVRLIFIHCRVLETWSCHCQP